MDFEKSHKLYNCKYANIRAQNKFGLIQYSNEVRKALKSGKPIIALESTIITHGMPYPENYETAVKVESIVRKNCVVPATIALLNGYIKVGLEPYELKGLADKSVAINGKLHKISRRDLPFALSAGYPGGTTVSATMFIAKMVNIKLFATGGIGGVHRGAEKTMDISADLTELGKTSVVVFSSGVKSILDIGRTLEYLETQGVPVCVLSRENDDAFPSFFSRQSGFKSPYVLRSEAEVANMIVTHQQLRLESGILVAVPIPERHALPSKMVEDALQKSMAEAERRGIQGKEVTPFLLERMNQITSGTSLSANVALVCNNADVCSKTARILYEKQNPPVCRTNLSFTEYRRPIVIGSSMVDILLEARDTLNLQGYTFTISQRKVIGGVGRNLADCICRMGCNPLFITCLGQDNLAKDVLDINPDLDRTGIELNKNINTSSIYIIIDKTGESRTSLCDDGANKSLSQDQIEKFCVPIINAPIVVIDCNIPISSMDYVLKLCTSNGVPVWVEPTDPNLVNKLFQTDPKNRRSLHYCSPNLIELQNMLAGQNLTHYEVTNDSSLNDTLAFLTKNLKSITKFGFHSIFVTLGAKGLAVLTASELSDPLPLGPGAALDRKLGPDTSVIYRPSTVINKREIINSSGAGDCLAGVIISCALYGRRLDESLDLGLKGAALSVKSEYTVPHSISNLISLRSKM